MTVATNVPDPRSTRDVHVLIERIEDEVRALVKLAGTPR